MFPQMRTSSTTNTQHPTTEPTLTLHHHPKFNT